MVALVNHISRSLQVAVIIALCLPLSYPSLAIAEEKPLLSEAIEKTIEAQGVSAAVDSFAQDFEKNKATYTVDLNGIANLSAKYAKESNYEASGAVMQIATPYMQIAITEATGQYSSEIANIRDEKIAEEKYQQEKFLEQERERQKQLDRKQQRDLSAATAVSTDEPLINEDLSYAATSSLLTTASNGRTHHSTLSINHAPRKVRFAELETRAAPVSIFRYDRGVLWLVHPERKGYEGVKLYQEFALTSGRGINGHIDTLMFARQALLSPEGLKNLGTETVNGRSVTHYYKIERNPGYEYGFNSYDYWIDRNGIMIKMQLIAPETSRTLQLEDIVLSSQDQGLFEPPADYKQAGHRFSWKEEQQKLGTN